MPTETLAMPFRGESRAPSFSGLDDESLLKFFDDFEALAEQCGLAEHEKCRDILRYVDFRTKQLWLTFDSYGSSVYQRFKDEIVYQYPAALKATQRCPPQLVRHRTPEKIERPAQFARSPARDVPTSTAFASRPSELSPAAAPFVPPPVVYHPALLARPVHAVPAPIVRRPAPRVHHVRAVPVDRRTHAALIVGQGHAAPIPKFTFESAAVPVVPTTAPLPFPLRPGLVPAAPVTARPLPSPITFVPPVCIPAPPRAPFCPIPALSASITAQVQPSSVQLTQDAVTLVSQVPREDSLHTGRALGKGQRKNVECSLDHRRDDAEDVAVQKEEGRVEQVADISSDDEIISGQETDLQPSDEEIEQCPIVEQQQKVETQQENILQRLDDDIEQDSLSERADEPRETINEDEKCENANDRGDTVDEEGRVTADERRETADEWRKIADEECIEIAEDRTWIADENWTCIADEEHLKPEERQVSIEEIQQKNASVKNDLENRRDTLSVLVPALLPAPEPPPQLAVSPDTWFVRVSLPTSESPLPLLDLRQRYDIAVVSARCLVSLVPVSARPLAFQHLFIPPCRKRRYCSGVTLPALDFKAIRGRLEDLTEAVTEKKSPFVAVPEWLATRVLEHSHHSMRNLFVKASNGDISQWPTLAPDVHRADRTISQAMVNISIATGILPTTELSVSRTRQLAESGNPLLAVRGLTPRSRSMSIPSSEPRVAHAIRDHEVQPRELEDFVSKSKLPLSILSQTLRIRRKFLKSRSSAPRRSCWYRACRRKSTSVVDIRVWGRCKDCSRAVSGNPDSPTVSSRRPMPFKVVSFV